MGGGCCSHCQRPELGVWIQVTLTRVVSEHTSGLQPPSAAFAPASSPHPRQDVTVPVGSFELIKRVFLWNLSEKLKAPGPSSPTQALGPHTGPTRPERRTWPGRADGGLTEGQTGGGRWRRVGMPHPAQVKQQLLCVCVCGCEISALLNQYLQIHEGWSPWQPKRTKQCMLGPRTFPRRVRPEAASHPPTLHELSEFHSIFSVSLMRADALLS